MEITPTGEACARGLPALTLSQPLDRTAIATIRSAWLEHHVLAFPNQKLTDDDLVRITNYFGSVGDDPYFVPISKKTQWLP